MLPHIPSIFLPYTPSHYTPPIHVSLHISISIYLSLPPPHTLTHTLLLLYISLDVSFIMSHYQEIQIRTNQSVHILEKLQNKLQYTKLLSAYPFHPVPLLLFIQAYIAYTKKLP